MANSTNGKLLERSEESMLLDKLAASAWATELKLMNNPVTAVTRACFDIFI
jgi:hypothetical protein